MKQRIMTVASVVVVAATQVLLPRHVDAGHAAAKRPWSLPASMYPAHTRISRLTPTNMWMDQEFGEFLTASYEGLGRIDGRGWAQVGLTTYPHSQGLTLEYAVSYFNSAGDMRHAAQSRNVVTAGRMAHGLYGGTSTGSGGGAVYAVFGRRNVLVDQYCWLTRLYTDAEERQMLDYCAKQRKALTQKLLALKSPVPPTPTSTSTPAPPTPPSGLSAIAVGR